MGSAACVAGVAFAAREAFWLRLVQWLSLAQELWHIETLSGTTAVVNACRHTLSE